MAAELGVSSRAVGELVAEAIEQGALIGSTCNGQRAGYFLVTNMEDLEFGTRHIRHRALGCLRRIRLLRKAAAERFAEGEVQRLFDLEDSNTAQDHHAA